MLERKALDVSFEEAANIVRDAGGRVVGRTRLQKVACLLELVGLGVGFRFAYRHYGPFSEDLASAIQIASLLGDLTEEEKPNSWGGRYSIFYSEKSSELSEDDSRRQIAQFAAGYDSIELELAVTAAFLAQNGEKDPWGETAARKPEKSRQRRLEKAKELYLQLLTFDVPQKLPKIA